MSAPEAILTALRSGQWQQARQLAIAALAQPDVDRGHLHALIGRIAWQLGDSEEAHAHLEAAVDRGIDDPAAWALLADLQQGRPDRRMQLLARAAAHPRGGGVHALALARTLHDVGRPDDALQWLARAADDPRSAAEALALAAELATQQGDLEMAADAVAQFVALEPPPDPLLLGQALQAMVALAPAEPAIDIALDRLQAAGVALATLAKWRALRQVALRDPLAATQWAAQAVAADPTDADAVRLLGECQLLGGAVAAAHETLKAAIAEGDLPASTVLAVADGLRSDGNITHATELVEQVTIAAPQHAGAWIELSRMYADLGRDADAEAAMVQAMALDDRVDLEAARGSQTLHQTLAELPALLEQVRAGAGWHVARLRMGHNALLAQLQQADGNTLFAKVALPGRRTVAHVAQTAALEQQLSQWDDDGPRVPEPLADVSGALAFGCAGGVAMVSHAVPGVSLRRTLAQPRATLTIGHGRALGQALGHVHRRLATVADWQRVPVGLTSAVQPLLALGDSARAWPQLRARLGMFGPGQTLGDALQDHLEALLPRLHTVVSKLPVGIVHGDFGWHNVTWQGEAAVGVVDFDYAARDVPLADLAQAIARAAADWKRLATHRDPAPRPAIGAAIVAGYVAIAGPLPVTLEELHTLMTATRFSYGLGLAGAGLDGDVRSPRGYGPALDALGLLQVQLDWLAGAGNTLTAE